MPIDILTTEATAGITIPEANGSANLSGNEIALGLRSDFLSAAVDVDAVVPVIPAGGFSIGRGSLTVSADAYDINVEPTLDVLQGLKLQSDLSFDKAVEVGSSATTTS